MLAHQNGNSLSENAEMFLMGRAVDQLTDLYPGFPLERFFNIPCQPEFIRSWHNHFDINGKNQLTSTSCDLSCASFLSCGD
jgi:hypothetical protein